MLLVPLNKMSILGIIPARFASTRFPGKPLAMIGGKTMIERVYQQASLCNALQKVIVATDDLQIAEHVESFGGNVVMTNADHVSGTDRCAEALRKTEGRWTAVINIQGDEPFIQPEQIALVADCFLQPENQIATLVKVIRQQDELENPNTPKVVLGKDGHALYFSRQTIPHIKGLPPGEWLQAHTFYKHIGIYGYRADILPELTMLPVGVLEKAESLEQLRWLEAGYRIITRITEAETMAVDTPEDLQRIHAHYITGDL
jgi:3-deoxy-manno-octulosonate cytidylyltransferase (CMP-KDO synthetase)